MTPEEMAQVKRFMPSNIKALEDCDLWIEEASLRVDRHFFGDAYFLAMAKMASHIGTMALRGNASSVGPVSSKSEGGISISFAGSSNNTDAELGQTTYGLAYLGLMKERRPVPMLTGF